MCLALLEQSPLFCNFDISHFFSLLDLLFFFRPFSETHSLSWSILFISVFLPFSIPSFKFISTSFYSSLIFFLLSKRLFLLLLKLHGSHFILQSFFLISLNFHLSLLSLSFESTSLKLFCSSFCNSGLLISFLLSAFVISSFFVFCFSLLTCIFGFSPHFLFKT